MCIILDGCDNLFTYFITASFVATTISGRTSSFNIGGYGYFCTYIVPSHFQHIGSPCFDTDDYIPVRMFLSHLFFYAFVLDLISFILDSTLSIFLRHSLVEGDPICNVSMCFQTMITS